MPQFTITISQAALNRLTALVDTYNANSGQSLTVAEWIVLHLKEVALANDLAAAAQALERQKQQELQQAIAAERERLLRTL